MVHNTMVKADGLTSLKKDSVFEFQRKLARYMEKQLKLALKVSRFQQNQLIEMLFDNLIQQIDVEYQAQLSIMSSSSNQGFKSPASPSKFNMIWNRMSSDSSLRNSLNSPGQSSLKYNHYYHVLADYYYNNPEATEKLQKLCIALITNQYLPSIYVLLFYKWMFDSDHKHLSLVQVNVFLKGVNRLFWSDVQNKTLKYATLYKFIANDVLLYADFSSLFDLSDPSLNKKVMESDRHSEDDGSASPGSHDEEPEEPNLPSLDSMMKSPMMNEFKDVNAKPNKEDDDDGMSIDIQSVVQTKKRDLICLIAKYYFYYENRDARYKLKPYIAQLAYHCSKTDSNFFDEEMIKKNNSSMDEMLSTVIGTSNLKTIDKDDRFMLISDMFVNENIPLLSSITDEEILLSLLTRFKLFAELEMSSRTMVKLQAAIYACTRPGTPNYPTRAVRHKASMTLDELFPSGKYARWWLNTSFRLLYFDWPISLLNWFKMKVVQLLDLPKSVVNFFDYHFNFRPQLTIQYDIQSCNDDSYDWSTTNDDDPFNTYSITFNK